jgi:hypothetical protein
MYITKRRRRSKRCSKLLLQVISQVLATAYNPLVISVLK